MRLRHSTRLRPSLPHRLNLVIPSMRLSLKQRLSPSLPPGLNPVIPSLRPSLTPSVSARDTESEPAASPEPAIPSMRPSLSQRLSPSLPPGLNPVIPSPRLSLILSGRGMRRGMVRLSRALPVEQGAPG